MDSIDTSASKTKKVGLLTYLSCFKCGRWGEVEIEKGPVDLFPTEPTDEDRQVEETLNHRFKGLLGLERKKSRSF